MFDDLRDFIETVEKSGECKVVRDADWDLEIGIITHLTAELADPPLLIFDNIRGYEPGYRVASNLFTTPGRTALGLGLPRDARGIELVKALRDKIQHIRLLPPLEVETGPVKENIIIGDDVDLFKFPSPKWHELDGGRYIGTGDIGITRDPDGGWINLGTYRTQVHDKSTVTMSMVPGHHSEIIRKKYWAKGLNCPVAISCGQDPTLWGAAYWTGVPWGVSEYDFAGGLRGEPVKVTRRVTTDLPIPASAEIVLEGEIVPPETETREEGPLGEWCGYYAAGVRSMPAVKIKSILHRNNPIIQGNPPHRLPSLWSLGFHLQKAAVVWDALDKQLTGIQGVWMLEEGALHSILVISIKQNYPGHAKAAAMVAAGCGAINFCCRFIIVVDDDIDPSNVSQVLWALGTRTDPGGSIEILHGCTGGASDPMLPPDRKKTGNYEMSRAIIIACRPYHWKDDFPKSLDPSPELARKIRDKWKDILL